MAEITVNGFPPGMNDTEIINYEKEFHAIVSDKDSLRRTVESFLDNIIDDLTLGVIFDLHRKFKTSVFCLDPADYSMSSDGGVMLGAHSKKVNRQLCTCPKCDKVVAAARFAPHLVSCMGMTRTGKSLRSAAGGGMNNKGENAAGSYSSGTSDDNDDEWNPVKKRDKRRKERSKNKKRTLDERF